MGAEVGLHLYVKQSFLFLCYYLLTIVLFSIQNTKSTFAHLCVG